MRRRSLAASLFVLTALSPSLADAQGPRRPLPAGFIRDTLTRVLTPDSTPAGSLRLLVNPPAQDSTRECQSSYPYVLLGGLVGAIVGSARYEEAAKRDYGEFDIPWLSMPLFIAPYLLGGMFLGYLLAPC